MSPSIYPLPKFLLEKQAEQIVGHSKPNRGPDNQHLLQPGGERPLVERGQHDLEQTTDHRFITDEFTSFCFKKVRI